MRGFIENVVQDLIRKNHPISDYIFILPNKRSGLFLKREVSKASNKTIFSPLIYDIDEFMSLISGVEKVSETVSPSMDIQLASNFERLLYDINNRDDIETASAMKNIKEEGKYIIDKEKLGKINVDFLSARMSEEEVLKTIKNVYDKYKTILDPHTAIGYHAFDKVNLKGNNIVLATAHPCKFPDAIKKSINQNANLPKELIFILDEKENYDIIDNNLDKIKKHIKERV